MNESKMDNALIVLAILIYSALVCVFGFCMGNDYADDRWRSRLVDNPDSISAVRSAVLAEREARAQNALAEKYINGD